MDIVLVIPLFLLLIGLEWWMSRSRGTTVYRMADSISNLGRGIGSLVSGASFNASIVGAYAHIHEHLGILADVLTSPAGWLGLLLGVDLCYYALHRAAHRMNLLRAGHAVHHQSEEYNFSVAPRQSWFIGSVSWLFYVPLVVLGYSPAMLLTARAIAVNRA